LHVTYVFQSVHTTARPVDKACM